MSACDARERACRLAKRAPVEENPVRAVHAKARWSFRLMAVGRGSRLQCTALALARLACACAGLASLPAVAQAAPEPELPTECGSRADFDAALKKRLGDSAPFASVQVSITRAASRFHLRVQIGNELRELDDPSCSELFRASVVIAVAMLMHDEQLRESPQPTRPVPAPVAREHPAFSVDAGGGLSIGTLPKPVLALELESKLLWRRWGVGASVRYYATAEHRDALNEGVNLQALGAGVTGVFRPSPLWEARLGFAAQRLSGEGAGSVAQRTGDSAWAAGPTLGLGFVPVHQGPFWAGLGAEGQLNAVRGRFQILHYSRDVATPSHEIYAVSWLAGSAFVRLGLVW